MAKLIFTNQEHAGQIYELTREKTTVGRAAGNTLVISDHSLSAAHCEVLLNGSEVIVRDLGSRNGTCVNGVKLRDQQSQLKSGQTVRFGSVEARLELEEQSYDDSASEMTAVHSLGRILREQRREREKPQPANAAMKLESSSSSPSEDRTVTSLTTSQAKENVSAAPAPSGSQPRQSSKKTVILIAVFAVGLILFCLWLSKK